MNESEYIAKKLIELRSAVGWSQSELARKCRVSSAAISQIEKGNRVPMLWLLRRLALAFNISLLELIGDAESLTPTEVSLFYLKFGALSRLSEQDQSLMLTLIDRLDILKID